MKHLADLSFIINTEKTVLFSLQNITFLSSSGLNLSYSPLVKGESKSNQSVPCSFSPAQSSSLQIMALATGSDGLGHPGGPAWPAVYEGVLALGGFSQAELPVSWRI